MNVFINNLFSKNNSIFFFNVVLFFSLLQNTKIPYFLFMIIFIIILLICNFRSIFINKNLFIAAFLLIWYFLIIALFNSSDVILLALKIKFWFGFLFASFFFVFLNQKLRIYIFIFRFLFILTLIEFSILNFFSDYANIILSQGSGNIWIDSFQRTLGFARNSSVSSSIFVCLFFYFYKLKQTKIVDWIFLLVGIFLYFSSTGFLILFLFIVYYIFNLRSYSYLVILKKYFILFILFLIIFMMPISQQKNDFQSNTDLQYQKISKSYYVDNVIIKFNNLTCALFGISSFTNYDFIEKTLNASECNKSIYSIVFGSLLYGEISTGSDLGLISFLDHFGYAGVFIIFIFYRFLLQSKFTSNVYLEIILLILISSFHYYSLSNYFSLLFFGFLIAHNKQININLKILKLNNFFKIFSYFRILK